MRSLSGLLDTLRRPAYTGARRCLPCTALNATILVACVLALTRRKRRVPALALATVGTVAIWLRGYLIPYTPQFAPRLVASLPVLDKVFHGDERSAIPDAPRSLADPPYNGNDPGTIAPDTAGDETAGDVPDIGGDRVLDRLLAAGVLVVNEQGALSLSASTRERWHAEMQSLRTLSSERLATGALAIAPSATEASTVDGDRPDGAGHWIVLSDSDTIATETWLSRPIAIAEVAAVRALDTFDLALEARLAAARPLRMFLDTCPDCGGPIEETTTTTCCGALSDPAREPRDVLACPTCAERLFTFPA